MSERCGMGTYANGLSCLVECRPHQEDEEHKISDKSVFEED